VSGVQILVKYTMRNNNILLKNQNALDMKCLSRLQITSIYVRMNIRDTLGQCGSDQI